LFWLPVIVGRAEHEVCVTLQTQAVRVEVEMVDRGGLNFHFLQEHGVTTARTARAAIKIHSKLQNKRR
jgi:hypothetical protein